MTWWYYTCRDHNTKKYMAVTGKKKTVVDIGFWNLCMAVVHVDAENNKEKEKYFFCDLTATFSFRKLTMQAVHWSMKLKRHVKVLGKHS